MAFLNFHRLQPAIGYKFWNQELKCFTDFSEKKNLMFLKTHKCGTSTLVNMFYLFGLRRRLNFVLQSPHNHFITTKYIGDLVEPRPNSTWNLQVQHTIFDPDFQHKILPKNTTFYTTILRSPIRRFQSAFAYFGVENRKRKEYGDQLSYDELVNRFLEEIKPPDDFTAPRMLYSNAHDLGWDQFEKNLDKGKSLNEKIDLFIKLIDSEMDFVMINDRFDESLVILKEYMCWNLTDMLYHSRLERRSKKNSFSDNLVIKKVQDFNIIDEKLYAHFLSSFEKHIEKFGKDRIASEVKRFQALKTILENTCYDFDSSKGTKKFSDYAKANFKICEFLDGDDGLIESILAELQSSNDYKISLNGTEKFAKSSFVNDILKSFEDSVIHY